MLNKLSNYNVLIVDDEKFTRNLLEECLTAMGCIVTAAKDGLEALKILNTGNFPLVISDIHMPEMDGRQLMEHISRDNIDTDMIIVTGDDEEDTLVDLIKAGAYDYLKKPFSAIELEAKLQKFFREKNLIIELNRKENLYRTLVESSPT